jgi:uncharacterized protein
MAARDVRKNLNLFVDGQGLAGQIDEFNAPKLELQTEDYRGGGMDGTTDVEMGIQKLTTEFSLFAYKRQVLALWGVAVGQLVPFVAREALESHDGAVTPVVHTMRGKITAIDPGASKPGALNPLKFTMTLDYYKLEHGGVVVHEIDVVNMIRIVSGKDVLAAQRAALGI